MNRYVQPQEEQRQTILPADPLSALDIMSQMTRQMLSFTLEEAKVLKAKDALTLARLEKGKELRANNYNAVANEFSSRLAEFQGLDEGKIGTLDALTVELGKATRENQKLIEAMSPKKPLNENFVNNLFLLQGESNETTDK